MTHLEIAIDDDVLVFDVAMRDSLTIQIVHRFDNLRKNVACNIFGQSFVLALLNTFEEVVGGPTGEIRPRRF